MNRLLKNIFFLFSFIFIIQNVFSQNTINIDENEKILIGKNIQFIEDKNKEFTLNEILSQEFQDKMITSESEILFFNYQNSTYWIKFTIKNTSKKNTNFFLVIDYPLLYKIKFFYQTKAGYDTLYSGDGYKFNKRKIKSATNVFEINLNKNEQKTYYCAIESDGDVVSLPIYIYTSDKYMEESQKKTFGNAFFYGILFIIVISNMFYFKTLRDKSYIIYIFLIIFLGLFIGARDGYTFQYLFSNFPYLNNISVSIFSMLSMLSILLMMIYVLETRKNFRTLHNIIIAFSIIVSLMIIPVFLPSYYRFFIFFGNYLVGIFIIFAIIILFLALKKKLFLAKYFLIAVLFLIIGSLFLILKNNGFTGVFQSEFLYKTVIILEIITLSYGLSARFNDLIQENKQEVINSLEKINLLKSNANSILEKEVKKRVKELNITNLSLKEKNDELIVIEEELRQNNEELLTQREHIEEQNAQFKELLKNLEDIYIKCDFRGNFINVSPSIIREFNISTIEEIYKTNVFDWAIIDDKTKKYFIKTLLQDKKIKNFAYRFKRIGADNQYAELNASVFYKRGKIAGYEAIIRNVTERVIFEEKLQNQKETVEIAHNKITSSINYAKRIQNALLTNKKIINDYFKNYFLIFKPKEQVSGDFYYVNKIKNYLIFAIADCTGHGVPGGFLTMLGITYLHEIVRRDEIKKTNLALNTLRDRFKRTFKTFGSNSQNGLDIALCVIDLDTNILQYSGAYNPLWIIRNNELIEYKATRNPIGFYVKEKDFDKHEIQLKNDDLLYIFSDGFQDQFGGDDHSKYSTKRFKELIYSIHTKTINEQNDILTNTFDQWKKDYEQTDDVTVLGIKWQINNHQ